MADEERSGRPKKVDTLMERRINRTVKKDPFQVSSKMVKEVNFNMKEENQITAGTFRSYAIKNNLIARRPLVKPPLTQNQIRNRLEFAKIYRNSDMRFWRNVLFCDEVSIQLFPHDRRIRVRRSKGECNERKNLVKGYHHGGGSLIFWGCICYDGVGSLVLINQTLTGERYKELLERIIPRQIRAFHLRSPYLLEDHAPCHSTQNVREAKERLGIKTFTNYPSNSPDLNPIEGVWSFWKDRVRARNPQTLVQLRVYCEEEWRHLTVPIIRKYISSMPTRLNEVYSNHGFHTKY